MKRLWVEALSVKKMENEKLREQLADHVLPEDGH